MEPQKTLGGVKIGMKILWRLGYVLFFFGQMNKLKI